MFSRLNESGCPDRAPAGKSGWREAPIPVRVAALVLVVQALVFMSIGVLSLSASTGTDTTPAQNLQLALFGAGYLVAGVFLLFLGTMVVQGRMWAAVVTTALLWLNVVQEAVRGGVSAYNLGVTVLSTALLLIPRSSRRHFGR
jgi:hypothetical protein